MEKLPRLDAVRFAKSRKSTFSDVVDLALNEKLDELRQMLLLSANNINENTINIDGNDVGDDFGDTTILRPRRTASRTADMKIKKNLNMPLKLRRPSSGNSLSGTFKCPKTRRTRVIKKHVASNPDGTSTEKSIDAIDEMNLVKKRTEQFEKMSKDQQVTLTPNRRNEAMNVNEQLVVATSSLDNVNNNVVETVASTVVSVESNVVESTTTTTTTKRVTRTKTRNMNKQALTTTDDSCSNAASSSTEDVFVKPKGGGRTKLRKELKGKLAALTLDSEAGDEPEPEPTTKVDREALAQKQRQKELAHKKAKEKAEIERRAEEVRKVEEDRKKEEEAAKKVEEEARRVEEEARRVEEEARRVEEAAKKAELERKEKERERERAEEKAAKALAAAKKKEADKLKMELLEKKRQEALMKKEAIRQKHEKLNKKRELEAKKREELLQASAAKKKEAAAEANPKTQKAADAKENMKPQAKPPVKPVNPVVSKLMNTTFTFSNYNMTPPRDERLPLKPKTVNDYGIDDAASSDSSDDESNPKKIVPNWAKSSELQEMVNTQSDMPLEIFQFLMSCETEPFQTLGYVNRIKRPRTSSAVWHTPINIGN